MSIELTPEQSQALAAETETPIAVIDPRSRRAYRLVPEAAYQRLEKLMYDDSPWTSPEMAALAGAAFGKLDDSDYSGYLRNSQ